MEHTHGPRGECPIVKLARESPGGWGSLPPPAGVLGEGGDRALAAAGGGVQKGAQLGGRRAGEGGGEEEHRSRFGIVLMCDQGMWPEK